MIDVLDTAGFVYTQGGNPRYLVDNLRSTRFLARTIELDLPWVTTSGSSMAAGDRAPDMAPGAPWVDGLAWRPGTNFAAHWDTFQARLPGFRQAFIDATGTGGRLVALEEETAVLNRDGQWRVFGERTVHVLASGEARAYRHGATFDL